MMNSDMNETLNPAISKLLSVVIDRLHPLRVILFGSAARTGAMPRDIDLLVVVPEGTHRRRAAQTVYREARGIGYPFDLVVVTPSDLERDGDTPGFVLRDALRDGHELYAA